MENKLSIKEQRVLDTLFIYPTRVFSVREIARLEKISHPTASAALKKLSRMGLAKREIKENVSGIGGDILWKANQAGEMYKLYKKIANLEHIYLSGLIEHIAGQTAPNAIVLFGSYSRGEDVEKSDIDLFVASKEKHIDLKKYESLLHRKISLTFETDLRRLRKEFVNNIINGIILYGYQEVIR